MGQENEKAGRSVERQVGRIKSETEEPMVSEKAFDKERNKSRSTRGNSSFFARREST